MSGKKFDGVSSLDLGLLERLCFGSFFNGIYFVMENLKLLKNKFDERIDVVRWGY